MKLLTLLLLMPIVFAQQELRSVIEDCGIPIAHIVSVQAYSETSVFFADTQEGIEDVLDTPVIEVLVQNEDDTWPIPSETYLTVIGVIEIEQLPIELWSSFGVVWNESEDRHWMFVFRNNISAIDDETPSYLCQVVEIDVTN